MTLPKLSSLLSLSSDRSGGEDRCALTAAVAELFGFDEDDDGTLQVWLGKVASLDFLGSFRFVK